MKKTLAFLLTIISVLTVFTGVFAEGAAEPVETAEPEVLRFGVSTERAPFVYYDENGELTGVDIELMSEIAHRMGMELEITEMSNSDLPESLIIGQTDVIGGALSKTKAWMRAINYSKRYYAADGVFISRDMMAQPVTGSIYSGLKIGVLKNSGFEEWVKEELYERENLDKANLYAYDRLGDAVKALRGGRVDIILLDAALYESAYAEDEFSIYEHSIARDNYAFGVQKGSGLEAEINKLLAEMFADGTAQKIAGEFLVIESETEPDLLKWTVRKTKTEKIVEEQTTTEETVKEITVKEINPEECTRGTAMTFPEQETREETIREITVKEINPEECTRGTAMTFPEQETRKETIREVTVKEINPEECTRGTAMTFPEQEDILEEAVVEVIVETEDTVETGAIPEQKNCWDWMDFLGDVSFPDGTYMNRGSEFTKSWRVMNTGTCTWTKDYSLFVISGVPMGEMEVKLEQEVRPGEIIDLGIDLTAPVEYGWYRGVWQLKAPEGNTFGNPVWTEIYVW